MWGRGARILQVGRQPVDQRVDEGAVDGPEAEKLAPRLAHEPEAFRHVRDVTDVAHGRFPSGVSGKLSEQPRPHRENLVRCTAYARCTGVRRLPGAFRGCQRWLSPAPIDQTNPRFRAMGETKL